MKIFQVVLGSIALAAAALPRPASASAVLAADEGEKPRMLADAALRLVDNLDFVKRLPLSPTQRSRFNAEAEGHTTSVDLCAADDMDPCMDSTCEMWDANKATLEDAAERLETCDTTEEIAMSSTTFSVDFAECDAVSDYESTCSSTEGEFRFFLLSRLFLFFCY